MPCTASSIAAASRCAASSRRCSRRRPLARSASPDQLPLPSTPLRPLPWGRTTLIALAAPVHEARDAPDQVRVLLGVGQHVQILLHRREARDEQGLLPAVLAD